MTTGPVTPGRPVTPGQPVDPAVLPTPDNPRARFVTKGQVIAALATMPSDQMGLLLVDPVGQTDESLYSTLAMHINPDHAFQGSMTFLVNTRPGADQYDVLDLNNLPPGVCVEVVIKATDGRWRQSSCFRGTEGNVQGGAS